MWLPALALALAWQTRAHAQSALTFGTRHTEIEYRVITPDTTNGPVASPILVPQSRNPNRFFNPTPGRITNQQVLGRSLFPTEDNMPGPEYLKAFNYRRPKTTLGPTWWMPWTWF
jgi:hypothetical protein